MSAYSTSDSPGPQHFRIAVDPPASEEPKERKDDNLTRGATSGFLRVVGIFAALLFIIGNAVGILSVTDHDGDEATMTVTGITSDEPTQSLDEWRKSPPAEAFAKRFSPPSLTGDQAREHVLRGPA